MMSTEISFVFQGDMLAINFEQFYFFFISLGSPDPKDFNITIGASACHKASISATFNCIA